ncbi:ABC transporter permease [Nocardioides ganghwensis]|jgi:ribose transport system permease protein|nr:ABC transporter permease [Nocardioides ganghwensis]
MSTPHGINFGEAPARTRVDQLRRTLGRRTEGRAVALLAVVLVVALVMEPLVFSAYPVTLSRVALVGLVALGLTVVILMGELDLSVASTVVLAGVMMAQTDNVALGVLLALGTGVAVGLVNAFFVVKVGINSFIATLGMLFVLKGLAIVISRSEPIPLENITFAIQFGLPIVGPLTPRIVIFVLAFVLLHLFLTRMRAGREFYAVGGNRQAARDAGIPVDRRLVTGFVMCSVIAAGAGAIDTLERTAADPTAGSTVLLSSFAAAIIGGVALTGGRGSILGTLIGAFSLGTLEVGLTLTGVQVDIQQIYIGGVLLLAVMTDPASLRAARSSLRTSLHGVRARSTDRGLT